jgi:PilZ domain-containing protein
LAVSVPLQVVRRSGRIPKEIPILLIGSDLDGRVFSESTKTVLLSLHGAGILSKHKLSPEQELILRWPENNKETEIRVVGNLGTHEGMHTYGVAFLDPNLNLWGLDFPPVSLIEREMGLLSLACSSCKTLEKIDDGGIEADICSTNEGVMRFCKRCGSSTLWKPARSVLSQESLSPASPQLSLFPPSSAPAPASPEARAPASTFTPSPVSSSPPNYSPARTSAYAAHPEHLEEPLGTVLTLPAPEKPGRPPAERRKHPRVKVTYSACVRHPQQGDEVVLCEDMSKGGLRFKSRKRYYAQSLIEVAVPYQPGQAAIFVPAQIVFVEELPEQQLFRHGVQYLKSTKPRDSF